VFFFFFVFFCFFLFFFFFSTPPCFCLPLCARFFFNQPCDFCFCEPPPLFLHAVRTVRLHLARVHRHFLPSPIRPLLDYSTLPEARTDFPLTRLFFLSRFFVAPPLPVHVCVKCAIFPFSATESRLPSPPFFSRIVSGFNFGLAVLGHFLVGPCSS